MKSLVENYLTLRRAVGFQLRATSYRLRSFADFAVARGETHIRVETATTWAASAISPQQRYVRLRDLTIFARHLQAEDPAHELPDGRVFARPCGERLPHILSDNEIALILGAAGRLRPFGTSRADTYRTLFGLLAATGLRVGEACKLTLRDLAADGLRIRNTKFRKSRLVPLHSTVAAALEKYRARWRVVAVLDDPFFVSTKGTALGSAAVSDTFREIVGDLGLRSDVPRGEYRRPRPCLHDMRHYPERRIIPRRPDLLSTDAGSPWSDAG